MATALMMCTRCGQPVEVDTDALIMGLTADIWRVLRRIYREGERIDVRTIAEQVHCDRTTVYPHLQKLEALGLAEMRKIKRTHRRKYWHLASKRYDNLTRPITAAPSTVAA